jgi:hypothetical protein
MTVHSTAHQRTRTSFACGIALAMFALPFAALAQRTTVVAGTIPGQDAGNHADSDVVVLEHSDTVTRRMTTARTKIFDMERLELRATRTGITFDDSFTFAVIANFQPEPGSDVHFRTFSKDPGPGNWVNDNKGRIYYADVDTRGMTETTRVGFSAIPSSGSKSGAAFLARMEADDAAVVNSISGTNNDLNGVRLGLESALTTLASEIDLKAGHDFIVGGGKVLFVPRDEGRKAIPFILKIDVTKPGLFWVPVPMATIYVPVSFTFARNATSDGYVVSVNPNDIQNRDRITVIISDDQWWDSDGTALLNATREAVAELDEEFYRTPQLRLQRAVDDARPARAAPSNFDVLMYTTSAGDGTTSANNPLVLRILEGRM